MSNEKKLTKRQELFCLNYVRYPNESNSKLAVRSGFKDGKTLYIYINKLLKKPYIMQRINELRKEVERETILSVQKRHEILSEIANAKLHDFIYPDTGQIKWDKPSRAIKSIETTYNKAGNRVVTIKLHSPIPAIQELNRMTGAYTPVRHEHTLTLSEIMQQALGSNRQTECAAERRAELPAGPEVEGEFKEIDTPTPLESDDYDGGGIPSI